MLPVSSTRFASAIACTEARWFRTAGRSASVTREYPLPELFDVGAHRARIRRHPPYESTEDQLSSWQGAEPIPHVSSHVGRGLRGEGLGVQKGREGHDGDSVRGLGANANAHGCVGPMQNSLRKAHVPASRPESAPLQRRYFPLGTPARRPENRTEGTRPHRG